MDTRGQQVVAKLGSSQALGELKLHPKSDLEPGTGCVQGTDNWDLDYWGRIGKLERPLKTSLIFQVSLGSSTKSADFMSGDSQAEQSSQLSALHRSYWSLRQSDTKLELAYMSPRHTQLRFAAQPVREGLHSRLRPAESSSASFNEMGAALLSLQPSFFSHPCAFLLLMASSFHPRLLCSPSPNGQLFTIPGCSAKPIYRHGF